MGAARGGRDERGDDSRRSGGADDGRNAIHAGTDDGVSARDDSADGRLQGDGGPLRRRLCAGERDVQAGAGGDAEPPRDRPHRSEFELLGVDAAPGALDEIDALFTTQGTFWNATYFQLDVRVAGVGSRGGDGSPVVGAGT